MVRRLVSLRHLPRRGHLSSQKLPSSRAYPVLVSLSARYSEHKDRLPTRYSPVRHSTRGPKTTFAFDLHVLSTPPAFVLSQDQTLQFNPCYPKSEDLRFYFETITITRIVFAIRFSKIEAETSKASPPENPQRQTTIFTLSASPCQDLFVST